MHKCNAFCFGGLHAVFMDYESTEFAHMEGAGKIIANQNGFDYAGFTNVQAPGAAPVGTPTREGVARGRVIIWGRRG
jgi:hypothetical protein